MKKIHLASIDESLKRIASIMEDREDGGATRLEVKGRQVNTAVLSDEDFAAVVQEMEGLARTNLVVGYSWNGVDIMPVSRIRDMEKEVDSLRDDNISLRALLVVGAPGLLEAAIKAGKIRP